jgi:hypothetical protein
MLVHSVDAQGRCMPLILDPDYMPERGADEGGGNVRCLDQGHRRVVNVFVDAGGLRRHGNAAGIDGNVIDTDVPGYLLRLLDPILAEASTFYDGLPDPKSIFLVISREGTRVREPGKP